jgi:hypothetical protein
MTIELRAGETKRLDVELTPLVQTGIIQGYVVDAETDEHIPSAAIYLDGEFALYSWTDDVGGYRIADIPYGAHTVTVEANNYQATDFDIVVDQPIQSITLKMPPLPPGPPGEWSDGVEVQSVAAEPPVAYPGETVNIDVYIQYGIHDPDSYPTPTTIFGTVKVNGQKLYKEFNINYRNPTLRFEYPASQLGEFTATAQDKSAQFKVVESPVAIYYPPHGGTRFPICTELIIPDGAVLTSGKDWHGIDRGWGNIFLTEEQDIDKLSGAHPSAWSPLGAVVRDWAIFVTKPTFYTTGVPPWTFVFVMPTDYDCPIYWETKEELANAIAETKPDLPNVYMPYIHPSINTQFWEWLAQFSPRNALFIGYRDWVKITYTSSGFQGHVSAKLHCPYCDGGITYSNRVIPALNMARQLLEHIKQEHPDHPLTEPAWF